MKILITGAAGFIGNELALKLVDRGDEIIGIDNLNAYYDASLKKARLNRLKDKSNFMFKVLDISDRETNRSSPRLHFCFNDYKEIAIDAISWAKT